jgi:hypothetical protein
MKIELTEAPAGSHTFLAKVVGDNGSETQIGYEPQPLDWYAGLISTGALDTQLVQQRAMPAPAATEPPAPSPAPEQAEAPSTAPAAPTQAHSFVGVVAEFVQADGDDETPGNVRLSYGPLVAMYPAVGVVVVEGERVQGRLLHVMPV